MTNYTLTETDLLEAILIEMAELAAKKRNDYAGDNSALQNFYDSAAQVNDSPGKSVEVLIATKQARLRHLLFTGRNPSNESIRDTLIDRAVYSVIAVALFDAGSYVTNK